MTPTAHEGPPPASRWSLGTLLCGVGLIAANVTLWADLRRSGGWRLIAAFVVVNLTFCLMAGPALRFRLIPMMVLFTTVELTEAMLQSHEHPEDRDHHQTPPRVKPVRSPCVVVLPREGGVTMFRKVTSRPALARWLPARRETAARGLLAR